MEIKALNRNASQAVVSPRLTSDQQQDFKPTFKVGTKTPLFKRERYSTGRPSQTLASEFENMNGLNALLDPKLTEVGKNKAIIIAGKKHHKWNQEESWMEKVRKVKNYTAGSAKIKELIK